MRHHLFKVINGEFEGEEFIVGADNVEEAFVILGEYFNPSDCRYICMLSDLEAEMSGLDEY